MIGLLKRFWWMPDLRLGQILIHSGLCDARSVSMALTLQEDERRANEARIRIVRDVRKLGDILIDMGKCTQRDVAAALKLQQYLRRGE